MEQSNYLAKILNVYIVYDLDYCPKNLLRNFTLKNCLFGATNMVKSSDKEKYAYSSYRIAFSIESSWSFDDDTAGNAVIFGVDNSLSSHTDNLKNIYFFNF